MTINVNMFGWIESYLRQIAGKHAPNLPDCITCIYAQVHLQPDVIATEIKDPTKTNKIGKGKGVIELQARVIIYSIIFGRSVILFITYKLNNGSSTRVFNDENSSHRKSDFII